MRRRLAAEGGLSALELGMLLPLLALLLTVLFPLLQAGWSYLVLARATAAGIRYATRAEENARPAGGTLTRRPTAAEVEAFVREAAAPLELSSVTVDPEPAGAVPGETVTVTTSHEVSLGPLASAANGIKEAFFGGGGFLPERAVVTVTARGPEE